MIRIVICNRLFTATLAIFLSFLLSGCTAFFAPATRPVSLVPKHLAVMPAPILPDVSFEGFPKSKPGAGIEAGSQAFVTGLHAMSSGGCSGAYCGVILIIGIGVVGVAAIIGGIYGVIVSPTADTIKHHESAMKGATYSSLIQVPLRDYVVSAALENFADVVNVSYGGENNVNEGKVPDYRFLAAKGADTVLEVALSQVKTESLGGNKQLLLKLKAQARIIRVADNQEIYKSDFEYVYTDLHTLEEWSEGGGKLLAKALQESYEPLANYIYSKIFLVYPFPSRSVKGFPISTFGLSTIYPPLSLPPFSSPLDKSSKVDSLHPTLRWESFPRQEDIEQNPSDMRRIQHVRYDLRVASVNVSEQDGQVEMQLGKLVIDQQGLESPEYKIGKQLEADALYVWTVRARFELDGRVWVTEWASQWHPGDYQMPPAPSLISYMFRTP